MRPELRHYLAAEAAALFGPGSDEHLEALTTAAEPVARHREPERDRAPVHTPPSPVVTRPAHDQARMHLLGMD